MAALSAQAWTVYWNFGGDWTALFVVGAQQHGRTQIATAPAYEFDNTLGYDGQYYRLLAHDPLMRADARGSIDAPRMRWRRILTPALVHLVALGRADWIDSVYLAVTLGFLGVGVYFSCRIAARLGLAVWRGALFVAAPATLVSLERQTIDLSLAALTVAFCWYALCDERSWRLYAVAALAPLARETGLILPAALALESVAKRDWKRVGIAALCAAPTLGWAAWVAQQTPSEWGLMTSKVPFRALASRSLWLNPPPGLRPWAGVAAGLEHLALAGVWLAFGLALAALWKREQTALRLAAALCVGGLAFVGYGGVWAEAYAFGRIVTPLLILVAVDRPSWIGLAPALLILPRIAAQLLTHVVGAGGG